MLFTTDEAPPRFPLGRAVATPAAIAAFTAALETPWPYLKRHVTGDWGEVDEADQAENELALREGFRILSAYTLRSGVRIWIITEADRSATTILLPGDY